MMVEVPPFETKGSGCPVTGTNPTATIILNMACEANNNPIPKTRKAGNLLSHLLAIRAQRKRRIIYRKTIADAPNSPSSSMTIAKIKSENACARKSL